MRSYRLDASAGLDGLRLDVSELPVPGSGEVLVEVRAASLSYREAMILEGRYVLPVRDGGIPLAEHVVLPATALVEIPDDLTDAEAATLPVAGLTAWNALTGGRGIRRGDTVLTLGMGGWAAARARGGRRAELPRHAGLAGCGPRGHWRARG